MAQLGQPEQDFYFVRDAACKVLWEIRKTRQKSVKMHQLASPYSQTASKASQITSASFGWPDKKAWKCINLRRHIAMETAKPAKLRLPVWLTDLLVTGLAYLQHTNESLSILRHLKPRLHTSYTVKFLHYFLLFWNFLLKTGMYEVCK